MTPIDILPMLDGEGPPDNHLPWESDFLSRLAVTGVVTDACKIAGISRQAVYYHRETNERFQAEWHNAMEEANDGLRLEARRRAVDGYDRPVFYQGAQCGVVREYSDALLMFTMRARMPDEYGQKMDVTSGGDKLRTPVVYLPQIIEEDKVVDADSD